jgi:hypothetical protein
LNRILGVARREREILEHAVHAVPEQARTPMTSSIRRNEAVV